jgi:hypothetical protein
MAEDIIPMETAETVTQKETVVVEEIQEATAPEPVVAPKKVTKTTKKVVVDNGEWKTLGFASPEKYEIYKRKFN